MDDGEGTEGHEQVVLNLTGPRGEAPPKRPPEPDGGGVQDDVVILPEIGGHADGMPPKGEEPPSDETPEVQILTTPDPQEAEERPGFAPVTELRAGAPNDDRSANEGSSDRSATLAGGGEIERSDRLVALEQRLLHEVASQRRELLSMLDERFAELDASLREGLAELRGAPRAVQDPDEPA